MKFNISIIEEHATGEKTFTRIGVINQNKSGKSFSLGIMADKIHMLKLSKDGKYLNALVTENTYDDTKPQTTYKEIKESSLVSDSIPF